MLVEPAPMQVRRETSARAAMFLQPRHDLDEVARAVAIIELPFENAMPGVLACAGRSGQAEDVGSVRNAATGA